MIRRSQWLTPHPELDAPRSVIVMVEGGDEWTITVFETRGRALYGLEDGEFITIRRKSAWKRRLALLERPPKEVSIFQAVRENGRWRPAKTHAD